MKFTNYLSLLVILTATQTSFALTDICSLKSIPLDPALNISQSESRSYFKKLEDECALSKKYNSFTQKLNKYGLKAEDLSGYQAIRYVQRSYYTRASLTANSPVELIYQAKKENYNLPVSERSPDIWRNFMTGIKSVEKIKSAIDQGAPLDFNMIAEAHKNFYSESCEIGDFSHVPNPGIMKLQTKGGNPWWKFKTTEEAEKAKQVVDQLNANYKNMDLVAAQSALTENYSESILQPLNVSVEKLEIYSGDELVNPLLVDNLLKFINQMINQARQNQHMVWKNHLMTPGEVAYFSQQLYVHIHPFYEGNGRTSRMIQEIILTLFNLPHGASGDLMDSDVLTNHGDYYTLAITKNNEQIDNLSQCLLEYSNLPRLMDVKKADPSALTYQCRVVAEVIPVVKQLNCTDEWVLNTKKKDLNPSSANQKSSTMPFDDYLGF